MFSLFTDFGVAGPYLGQLEAVLLQRHPAVPVVNLFADAPRGRPGLAAYLLAAYSRGFPPGTIFVCVVDPGVGSDRRALALQADDCWYLGPDNGLLEIVAGRACVHEWWRIDWRPQRLSRSFHGRDLFAPVAARIHAGARDFGHRLEAHEVPGHGLSEELFAVAYIDHFGNAVTGIRARAVRDADRLRVRGSTVLRAETFADVPVGEGLWYENSSGLVEIAVNCGSAAVCFGLTLGEPVEVLG